MDGLLRTTSTRPSATLNPVVEIRWGVQRIVCEHWKVALIPPTERRFVPPSPEEQEQRTAEVLAQRAESDARLATLIPVKREALQAGPLLRDLEAAMACGCSCHPKPASPDSHDGGVTCHCQQTPAERKAAFNKLFEFTGEDWEAERIWEERVTAELQLEAERLGVTAKVVIQAAPLVITGVCDGRAFYLRERHGSWRVTIATDDDPLADPWESPLEETTIDIASGEDNDFNNEDGFFSRAIALRVAVTSVRGALLRNYCQHEEPDFDAHLYCRWCGAALAESARSRWSTGNH